MDEECSTNTNQHVLAKEALELPLSSSSGELFGDMGIFSVGQITIAFTIKAQADIAHVATFIFEDGTRVMDFKVATVEVVKSLQHGANWSDSDGYHVGQPEKRSS